MGLWYLYTTLTSTVLVLQSTVYSSILYYFVVYYTVYSRL